MSFENLHDPKVWGPIYWRMFHIFAKTYPENPNAIDIDTASGLIMRIPTMLPCSTCSGHALTYIRKHYPNLEKITSCRKELCKFFSDFHNTVNLRLGKPIVYK